MSKQSPLQQVNKNFGSKQDLAKRLAEVLEPSEGETKEQLAERLRRVANGKLLHLDALAQKVARYGGRDGLVAKVAEFEKKAKDNDFVESLRTKRSLGWLVDRVEAHERRARKATKPAK